MTQDEKDRIWDDALGPVHGAARATAQPEGRCHRCGGPLTTAYGPEPYCPDMACYINGISMGRIIGTRPTEPGLSVVLARVVTIVAAAAVAVAIYAGATHYGGWNGFLAGLAAVVVYVGIHETLSAKVK